MKPVVAEGHNFAVPQLSSQCKYFRRRKLKEWSKELSALRKTSVKTGEKKEQHLEKNITLAFLLDNIVDPSGWFSYMLRTFSIHSWGE